MGIDLVSACIFCAGFLLGGELPPRDGLSPEIGLSYSTLAREIPASGEENFDVSDVTPKFVLIGLGNARSAPAGLGAGTPAFEWRLRVAFGPSHDEQLRNPSETLDGIETDGTGRYENFALLGRFPIGGRGSLEAALNRRRQNATDVLNIGGEQQTVSEQRNLTAERADGALGWRQRWECFEAAVAAQYAKVTGYNATAGSFTNSAGGVFGGSLEGRWRRNRWTVIGSAELLSGSIDVHEESFPNFEPRDSKGDVKLEAYRFALGYSWPRTDLFATVTYDRERLPFVSLAVLGAETVAFDDGYHPDSLNEEIFGDLTVRYAFTPAIRARLGLRLAGGQETVTLTDAVGDRPTRILDVDRGGRFGGGLSRTLGFPELTFFLGADFAIGSGR